MALPRREPPTLFLNATLIDGKGGTPVKDAAVRVEGNRITNVGRTSDWGADANGNQRTVDLQGKTLMPGMVEAHIHVSYWGAKDLQDLDLKLAPENSTVYAVKNCELMLRCGFTSGSSAGAVHRVDVTVRNLINEGVIPGPRLLAAGRDICGTSGMLDWNPSFWKLGMDGLGIFADGVEEVRKAVRTVIRDGADVVKLYTTGEGLLRPGMPQDQSTYTDAEVEVAVEEAHRRGRRVAAHTRGNDGIKQAVRAGVDMIEHATLADDEAIQMLIDNKDSLYVMPGLNFVWALLERGEQFGIPRQFVVDLKYEEEWESGCRVMTELHKAGVPVLPGGDYGFVWCPHGEYAHDLELFVKYLGFTPMEALVAATKQGGELMGMDVGTVEEGRLADLLIVDGDPLADITVLQDRSKIALVMKDGQVMVNSLGLTQELSVISDNIMDIERIQWARAGVTHPTAAEVEH
ncbi:MAG: amidohydrolase family protein [Thermoleophilia bacterium]|nr:amidohydrolase family protein [Thermoleophilia bacterium]